ncbi:MAG: phospho-N-acetylmuramoyl-pentapeptide-transferase [Bifidobacteriaceae bacterium]|jgi:phospho-N-acetylmuramoyl-pentapeptide-transferase|nr:phospho-N-acetylmuramoyl-pentapeptide-transferase [Bifidobacteriaceae bacterium]
MIPFLIAVFVSMMVGLFFTPFFIKFLKLKNAGQFIRLDGPQSHMMKRGTPTMGGVVIIFATSLGYACASVFSFVTRGSIPAHNALLLLGLMIVTGLLGFVDDFKKISHKRSLGIKPLTKIIWQIIIGVIFAFFTLQISNFDQIGVTIYNNYIFSFESFGTIVAVVLFFIWVNFLISAWSNAVNLTDGLDGLAIGVSLISFAAFVLVCFWEFAQRCTAQEVISGLFCYKVNNAWDLAIIAGAVAGACFGFLWWNAAPAKIFMGDTGSLSLGATFAGLSILAHAEFLAVIVGGVFVLEVFSDIIQISFFKLTKKRVFKMAPIHHHFELKGWNEVTVVIRFWLLSGLFAALAVGIFYGGWVLFLMR